MGKTQRGSAGTNVKSLYSAMLAILRYIGFLWNTTPNEDARHKRK